MIYSRALPRIVKASTRCLNQKGLHSLSISEEVREALANKKPVVALESTVITHGLKYPENLNFAFDVENAVRKNGAVPATIAFYNGAPVVGASKEQITALAESSREGSTSKPVKASRRDIPYVMSKGLMGGTTIASTMILAHKVGIKVFATGGLGGVHRGFEETMDVSADLEEFGKTPVGVICSGPKSILDIPRTIEYLETKGVHVSTLGPKGTNIPGFFTSDSGVPSPYNFSTPRDAAEIIHANEFFGLQTGSVFCVPVPPELSLPKEYIEKVINEALAEAVVKGVSGKEVTPFLLGAILKATGGKSLTTNVAFLLHNAEFAAKVAQELIYLENETKPESNHFLDRATPSSIKSTPKSDVDCVVVGGVAVDLTCQISNPIKKLSPTSYPGKTSKTLGGVGYNVAKASFFNGSKHNVSTAIVSSVGKDSSATVFDEINSEVLVSKDLKPENFNTSGINVTEKHNTASYVAIHDNQGDLIVACADMDILTDMDPKHIAEEIENFKPKCVLFDGNIGDEQKRATIEAAQKANAIIGCEPTSETKAAALARVLKSVVPNNSIHFATPNVYELSSLQEKLSDQGSFDVDNWFVVIDSLSLGTTFRNSLEQFASKHPEISDILIKDGVAQKSIQILPYIPNLFVKLGSKGVLIFKLVTGAEEVAFTKKDVAASSANSGFELFFAGNSGQTGVLVQYIAPIVIPKESVVSVTGAGDTFAGVILSETAANPDWIATSKDRFSVMNKAQQAAVLTIQSSKSVSEKLVDL